MQSLAILLTCHNRVEQTLVSLESLYKCDRIENIKMDVYLVDDGSKDGTSEAVAEKYPSVNIIPGSGNLFWNQGMRLAWNTAYKHKNYDFYFWLNDDTMLFRGAMVEMFNVYKDIIAKQKKESLIVGACQENIDDNSFSYGLRSLDNIPLIPNGLLQNGCYVNGNAVLVSKAIFKSIGMLSDDYIHALGDIDYGMRVVKGGFYCYTTRKFIGTCERHKEIPNWINSKLPVLKRLQLLHSPRGLDMRSYIKFRKKFWGNKWILFAIKAYLRCLFPSFYKSLLKYGK